MGDAREAYTGLGMALAFDYVDGAQATARVRDQVDKVVATLYKLAHRGGGGVAAGGGTALRRP